MIGRTAPTAAFAARLMDTGNIFSDSGVTGGSDSGAPWFAVAAATDFINCGGVCFSAVGDDVEEEGVVVGAVLGVSSSGDSLLRVRLGVSSSGVSFGCWPGNFLAVLEEVFIRGDLMRGLEAFFMGDSSGGGSVPTAARFVGAVAAGAGARATGTRAWGVAPRATGARVAGASTCCTVDDAFVSFSIVSR